MPNFYFNGNFDSDPTNGANWWDLPGGGGGGGTCYNATPTGTDDCFIDAGVTCSTSAFSYQSLTVDGNLITSAATYTVTTNNGTISTNNGTVGTNNGTVIDNTGTITTRASGGVTTNEYETVDVPTGYNVTNLYANISTNAGTIGYVTSGYLVDVNSTLVTTVASGATVNTNNGTITSNLGSVETNVGTVTTNETIGYVTANLGVVTSNLGTVRIGTITNGTGNLAASGTTNLSSHTSGANVTLPSGNTTWW